MKSKVIHGYEYFLSDKPEKKLMVKVNGKFIYFGDSKFQHYKDKTSLLPKEMNHLDPLRRTSYIMRASKIENKYGNLTYKDPTYANYHALEILW